MEINFKNASYTVGTYSPGKLSVVYEMSMQVLPTVPSPTTTHLIGRPEDMIDPSLEPHVTKKKVFQTKCTKSRKSILAVFWVSNGHLESVFAYLYPLDPLLFVPEWPFLQLLLFSLGGEVI